MRYCSAIPEAVAALTLVVPFGNLEAVERVLGENRDEVAGMIVEPIMMNIGMIPPPPGYLQALKDLLHAHGALPHLRRGEDRLRGLPRWRDRARPGSRPT